MVELRDSFALDSASRRFSAFDVGPLWPVANVKSVTEAFTAAHLIRCGLKLCPNCGIDAVIPVRAGMINTEFLSTMRRYWF